MNTPAAITDTPRRLALRQQVVERALLEQRVAPGEHDDVEVGLADEVRQHLGLVHPRAVGGDDALRAQLLERREGPVERLPVVLVGIVHEQEVDAVEPEALEAGLERGEHAVAAVVAHAHVRGRHVEALGVHRVRAEAAGASSRPTFVETTNPSRPASPSASRRSASPSP